MKFAVLVASLAFTASAQIFPIAGVMVDGLSGAPMNRVRVILNPYGRVGELRAVVTGADGRFAFEAVQGKFVLTAEYRGYRQQFGQRGPDFGFNIAIVTGPDQDTSNLTFPWLAPGAISGKVIDDHGESVENALVQLIRVSLYAGHKIRSTIAWARTNDLGEYRFGQCAAATYYLAVTGEPWYTAQSQTFRLPGQPVDDTAHEPVRSYAPVYYPNSADPDQAQPLQLGLGGEVKADFRLATVTGVTLHIHCPHPAGQSALINLISDGAAGVDAYQRQVWLVGNQNDQTIAGVLPGRYLVSVNGSNGYAATARKAIDVGGSDVTVELAMEDLPTISGKVVFSDPNRKPRRAAYVRLIAELTGATHSGTLDPSGAFSFKNAPLGRYFVRIGGTEGFYATRITVEGAALNGSLIEIVPGAKIQLNIVASGEIGALKGFVINGDKPVAGALAVLAPPNDSKTGYYPIGFRTDSDGSFDYQHVPAGDYVLFAVDGADLEYSSLAAIRSYLATGMPIQIPADAVVTKNISLTAPKPQ